MISAKRPRVPGYQLTSTNLTGLGGPMGTETTSTNYVRFFRNLKRAKQHAEEEYTHRTKQEIRWRKDHTRITSGDLGYVMYEIEPIRWEDA